MAGILVMAVTEAAMEVEVEMVEAAVVVAEESKEGCAHG